MPQVAGLSAVALQLDSLAEERNACFRLMNRREFLFFTNPRKNTAELSCQQLYMRYLDSTLDGTTPQFLQEIEQRLSGITSVRLTDSVWLSSDELKPVASLLDAFRARGGRIEYKSPKP